MRVLFAASECIPFIKTGGLADVVGTLPKALAAMGADARVILPKYRRIAEKYRNAMHHVFDTTISLGWRNQYLGIDCLEADGVIYYFVDNEFYFGEDYIYGSGDFETERFCFFCSAALEALPKLDFIPDILHCNDWQTGFIPLLQSTQYKRLPDYRSIKTVYTIHNLRYQGICNHMLADDLLSIGSEALQRIEYSGGASAMKAGIAYADKLTTVSPTYAKEIRTPEYGETLDCDLRLRENDLLGILNGIDNTLYNPWTDKDTAVRYSKNAPYGKPGGSSPRGKLRCKQAILKELGLYGDMDAPLLAVISRLADQKGIDLVVESIPHFMEKGCRMVVLGMGEKHYESFFSECEKLYPNKFAFRSVMDDALARRIYAGSDIFIMPSVFEPCGLSQMFALRYGCIPVVRETGGLSDSVFAYNKFEDSGNGFSFKNYSAEELIAVTDMALELYVNDKDAWLRLIKRAMATDYDWGRSAKEYLRLYDSLK